MNKILPKDQAEEFQRWEVPTMEEGFEEPELEILDSMDALNEPPPEVVEIEEVDEEKLREEALAELRKRAYDEGLAAGHEAGLKAAEEEAEEIRTQAQEAIDSEKQRLASEQESLGQERERLNEEIAHFQQLVAAMGEPLKELDEQVEEQLVELCLAISQQLIHRELKTETGEIVAVVREAVSVLPLSKNEIQIYLHPEDLVIVREALSLDEGASHLWQLLEDPLLTRGGCRVVSEDSHVDAAVESRLRAVAARLLGGERDDDRNHS